MCRFPHHNYKKEKSTKENKHKSGAIITFLREEHTQWRRSTSRMISTRRVSKEAPQSLRIEVISSVKTLNREEDGEVAGALCCRW